jgi:tetratricopeptide (TPR) repeat protein
MNTAYIFYHIPKTAGSTLWSRLELLFKDNFYPAYFTDQVMSLRNISGLGKDIAICGHAAWGVHEYLQGKFEIKYFTALREPWSLFLSFYRYEAVIYKEIGGISSYFKRYDHNLLTKYLGDGDVSLAEDRLFSFFSCYGIMEEFPISIRHFYKKIGLNLGHGGKKNIGIPMEFEIPDWMHASFIERNKADIDFYHKAKIKFIEQTSNYLSCSFDKRCYIQTGPDKTAETHATERRSIPESADGNIVRYVTEALAHPQAYGWYLEAMVRLQNIGDQALADAALHAGYVRYPLLLAVNEAARLRSVDPDGSISTLIWLIYALNGYKTEIHDSYINQRISAAKLMLATVYEDIGRFLDAETIYRECITSGTEGFKHLQQLMVLLRKQCRYKECRDLVLENESVVQESHAAELNRELAVAYFDWGDPDRAYELMARTVIPETGVKLDKRLFVSAEYLKSYNKFAIINTGPTMVCDYALHKIIPDAANLVWISSYHAVSRLKNEARGPIYFMPEGLFNYDNDIEKIDPAVFELNPEMVIIMMSKYDPKGYRDIIKLARSIKDTGVYCYALDFIFSEELKYSLVRVLS